MSTESAPISLPYFDILLERLDTGIIALDHAFGRHVHWGYWPDPSRSTGTSENFAEAAEALSRQVYQAAGVKNDQTYLDAGCGFGGTLASLNENFTGMKLTGLNIHPRQIARAEKKIQARSGNTLRFVAGDACAMPFPDASFDVISAVECIFHFPSRRDFFAQAHRVLKPGGTLAICDFLPKRFFRWYLRTNSARQSMAKLFGPVQMDHTLGDYRQLAAASGFKALVEKNITRNTIPTYPFLRKLTPEWAPDVDPKDWGGRKAEWVSRLGLLEYWVLAWRRD